MTIDLVLKYKCTCHRANGDEFLILTIMEFRFTVIHGTCTISCNRRNTEQKEKIAWNNYFYKHHLVLIHCQSAD